MLKSLVSIVKGTDVDKMVEEALSLLGGVDSLIKPGSVVVDLAAANGGNCALSEADREVSADGVLVLGPTNLPSDLPVNASQMFSKNVVTFLQHLVSEGELELDLEDEITKGAMLTHGGEVTQADVREKLGLEPSEGGS